MVFTPGKLVITEGARFKLDEFGLFPGPFISDHLHGEFGNICAEDVARNIENIGTKGMIMSSYTLTDLSDLWVITDPGHEVTTVLLPEEY